MKLTWLETEEIGFELSEKFPNINPLTLRFTDLHKMVIELENFSDNKNESSEGILESIQMVWYDEWKENQ